MKEALLWWSLIILAVVALGVWGFSHTTTEDPDGFGALPWIEVITDDVFVQSHNDDEALLAQTGDELPNGATIYTSTGGSARIHFPDGSFARLDPASELEITSVSFDPNNDELLVSMLLASGRVWSKVVSLATEDSLWEVRTSQAVAAVRGTAFGVEVDTNIDTRVMGIEDEVAVTHPDDSNDEEVLVVPDTTMSMRDGVMSDLFAMSDELKDEDYRRFVDDKEELDELLEELRGAYKNEHEWRKALRQQKVEAFREAMKNARSHQSGRRARGETDNSPQTTDSDRPQEMPVAPTVPAAQFLRLDIVPGRGLDRVMEGDSVPFKAVLISSNGEQKDVTSQARWNVVGEIGAFDTPGSFKAQLAPEHREFGAWPGGVSASFKDEVGGQGFEGASEPFKVHTKLEPNSVTQG